MDLSKMTTLQYLRLVAERLAVVNRLAELALPVGTPGEMKRESLPEPGERS
jgi:hypothetical protein